MSLRALLRALAGADIVCAVELARRTGIPPASIRTQVARARALGIRIEARRGVGYRLAEPLDLLDAVALQCALPSVSRHLLAELAVVATIDSTSSELLRRAAAGAASGTVLMAEHQGAGRGRRGRAWHSPFGVQVCLSILWRFARGPATLGGLSLAVGVAVQRALVQLGCSTTALKWPNDVMAGDQKLAGVLVELGRDPAGPCHAVVGVGLNARMSAAQGAAIDQPWTDLATLLGGAMPARTLVAATLVGALLPALEQFAREGLAPFLAEWRAHDALVGREVDLLEGLDRQTATVLGIDAQGLLRVHDRAGRERALASAAFSVRALPRA